MAIQVKVQPQAVKVEVEGVVHFLQYRAADGFWGFQTKGYNWFATIDEAIKAVAELEQDVELKKRVQWTKDEKK